MINTVNIKQQQLDKGFFTTGSGNEVILIMGSCRVAPYVNYLNDWNKSSGNRFTIHSLDPFNFNWNQKDDRVDYETELAKWQTNSEMIGMLKSANIFIHEYYRHSGFFNVEKETDDKNIYQFGMQPEIDICLPNFNDYFILFNDIASFDIEAKKMALQDLNVMDKISDQTKEHYQQISQRNLDKFYEVCLKSDIPEMKDFFEKNYKNKRMWWTYNHVSKNFTLAVFNLINDKFLHLELSKGFNPDHEDMFANNYTKLSDLDVEAFGYDWGEEIVSFTDKIRG